MKDWIRYVLYFLNVLAYVGVTAVWIANPGDFTLNGAVTVFNLCFSLMLVVWDRERFSRFYKAPRFSSFVSSLIGAFWLFCILGLINYLSFKHPAQMDLTRDKKNSLTERTLEVLKNLDPEKKLSFVVFSRKNEFGGINALLQLFRYQRSNVDIDFKDIELRPDMVKRHNIRHSGTIMVRYNGRKTFVTDNSELGVVNAIIKVKREKNPVVYYSVGHQELDINRTDQNGLSSFIGQLKAQSFTVKKLHLAEVSKVPPDADMIIVWGPKLGLFSHEIDLLRKYLDGGGRILVGLDPDLNNNKLKSLRNLLEEKGIVIRNNLVIDIRNHVSGSNGTVPLVKKFDAKHEVTRLLSGPVFFPLASSIGKSFIPDAGGELTLVAHSSSFPDSWAENTPREVANGDIKYNDDTDEKGPIALAGAWEGHANNERIFVLGNSTLISNVYEKFGMNYDFVMRAISWLVDKDSITSFNLPIGKVRPVFITPGQLGIVFYFSVISVPLVMSAFAFFIYRRRRKF